MKIRKGMTLIEVIISMAVIGLIAMTMLSVFNTGLVNITRSGSRTTAIAESETELSSADNLAIDSYNLNVELIDEEGSPSIIVVPVSVFKGSVSVDSGLAGSVSVEITEYRYDPD